MRRKDSNRPSSRLFIMLTAQKGSEAARHRNTVQLNAGCRANNGLDSVRKHCRS